MLRAGQIPRALVVGHDLVMKVAVDGFRHLQLYSQGGCRPFDRDRDGIVLGEGVAAVVLEASDVPARFELLDGAIAHDASHIAAGSSDGLTAARVMVEALRRSGVGGGEVTAIKAHGTGTPTNDLSELRGLERAFEGRPPPFASLKAFLGHTTAASSLVEMAHWLACLEEGFVPASLGFANPLPESPHAPLRAALETGGRPGVHMFNAFGFGGSAVSYLVRDHGAGR